MASIGCVFDRSDELIERLQHAPGEEARQELAPTPDGPAPSRWTLRGVRATFPWLKHYTLSGVWRLLRRHKLHIRSARVRQHSPDPEYLTKLEHLLSCLRDAAAHPDEVVLVFLGQVSRQRGSGLPRGSHSDPGADASVQSGGDMQCFGECRDPRCACDAGAHQVEHPI